MERIAFQLEEGQLSKILATRDGYCIIRVEEKNPPALKPYDECREAIKVKLLSERQSTLKEQLDRELRQKVTVRIYEKNLELFLAGDIETTPGQ
jgi:parvulin-like peptidyl-prolyl isomerase